MSLAVTPKRENALSLRSKAIRDYLAEIGAKGGAAGKGASKKRSPEHYRKIVAASVKARAAKKKARA
jgi:hypothetical protein